jgi:hypothetical protein
LSLGSRTHTTRTRARARATHKEQGGRQRTVEVEVAKLVGEDLHLVGREARVVGDDVVVRGRHRALLDRLRDQEEVVPRRVDHVAVHHGARLRVGKAALALGKDTRMDALLDDDHGQTRLVGRPDLCKGVVQLGDLVVGLSRKHIHTIPRELDAGVCLCLCAVVRVPLQ